MSFRFHVSNWIKFQPSTSSLAITYWTTTTGSTEMIELKVLWIEISRSYGIIAPWNLINCDTHLMFIIRVILSNNKSTKYIFMVSKRFKWFSVAWFHRFVWMQTCVVSSNLLLHASVYICILTYPDVIQSCLLCYNVQRRQLKYRWKVQELDWEWKKFTPKHW